MIDSKYLRKAMSKPHNSNKFSIKDIVLFAKHSYLSITDQSHMLTIIIRNQSTSFFNKD